MLTTAIDNGPWLYRYVVRRTIGYHSNSWAELLFI